jgi:hypothetical protein
MEYLAQNEKYISDVVPDLRTEIIRPGWAGDLGSAFLPNFGLNLGSGSEVDPVLPNGTAATDPLGSLESTGAQSMTNNQGDEYASSSNIFDSRYVICRMSIYHSFNAEDVDFADPEFDRALSDHSYLFLGEYLQRTPTSLMHQAPLPCSPDSFK